MAGFSSKLVLLCCASLALLGLAAGQNAPEVVVAPPAMHVDYGSTAYMACVAYIGTESQSIGVVSVMNWYNPHSQLLSNTSDGRVSVTTTVKVQNGQYFMKSILKVCNFTTNDFGSYSCRATNVYGQDEKSWIVSIVRLPISPRLVAVPSSFSTTAGNTVYMTCAAYGYPYPVISWTLNGQTVQSNGIVNIDSQLTNYNGANVTVSTLRICGADSDYVGSYTCSARVRDNPQVATSSPWRLDVPPVPQISNAPEDHTINYGVTAYMTCTAYIGTVAQGAASLTSALTWLGPDTQTISNATDGSVSVYSEMVTINNAQVFIASYLKLCNFSQTNIGQYTCQVSNANGMDIKAWNVSFPYPVSAPQLTAQPSSQTVTEGNTVYMTCAFYGYPFPDVVWYKNNAVVTPSISNSTLSTTTEIVNFQGAQLVQSTLKICLVGIEDAGAYSCRATTRDSGTVQSADATLTVRQVPAIIVAPQSQDITYGVTFVMSCAAHFGNTAQNAQQLDNMLIWTGPNGQQLANSTNGVMVYTDTMTTSQGHVIVKSVIQICGFMASLQGNYSCTASNVNGQDRRTWTNSLPRQPVAPSVVTSPTTQTVSEGSSVFMSCSGYGYPYPRITWYRNNQPLDPNLAGRVTITTRITNYMGAPITESIMKICGAGEEDHGSYYCSFSSSFGNAVNTNTWQVNVSPAPTIVVAPQSQNVEYGNTVYMTCAAHLGTQAQASAALQTATTFMWLGPDSQPIDASQVTTDTTTTNGRVFARSILTVCNFATANTGQYTCIVSNANGNENRTWSMAFPETPVIPQLAVISAYESVTYGRTVYFTCAMYGYPQPEISWTLNDSPLETTSTTVTTSTLTINNVNVTQSVVRVCNFRSGNVGLYLCSGTNGVGTGLGYVRVIPEAPEIIAAPTTGMSSYSHTIYMSCIAYIGRMNRSVDQLTTTFSWWDDSNNQLANSSDGSVAVYTDSFTQSGLVFMRSVLKICNFTQPDTGLHTCTAMNSNGQDSTSWNLTFLRTPTPPQFLVTPSNSAVTGGYGRTVILNCAAYGFPFPQITWTLNGQVILPNDTMYRVNYDSSIVNYGGAQVSQSTLRICGVGEEDIGSYVCTATTSALAATITSPSVAITVNPVPSFVVAPQDQEVTFGKTTLMTCVAFVGLSSQNAANIPTALTWWNPSSQMLANNSDNSVSVYSRTTTQGGRVFIESILKMCNFSQSLEGVYTCQVTNNNGNDARAWNVSLHQEPFAPMLVVIPAPQTNRRLGFTVLMACAAYGYPPPLITFNRFGQPIDEADLDGPVNVRYSVQNYLGNVDIAMGVLEVCSFGYDDAVNYTCTATARNVGQDTSDPWTVGLIAAPYLVSFPPSQDVSYDTVLRMTCIASLGRPDDAQYTTVTWYDSAMMRLDNSSDGVTVVTYNMTNSTDNIVYVMSTAVVTNIRLMHLGELSCVANNSLGSDVASWNVTSVIDYFAPQGVTITNSTQALPCSSTPLTLTCSAWGYPPPTIVWSLNGDVVSSSDRQTVTNTPGTNYTDSTLVINQFNVRNVGSYVCNASNILGSATSQPVQFTLQSTVNIETSAPKISSSQRTSSELAVVEFTPVATNPNWEFRVTYYNASNSSGTPVLSQLMTSGVIQTPDTQITISNLDTCSTYWVIVTVVNRCGVRRSNDSTPSLIGLHDVATYQLLVTLPSKPCSVWVTEDVSNKVSAVTSRIGTAASNCGRTLPCLLSSQWQCSADKPMEAKFSTQVVGNTAFPSASIISCLNTWFRDNPDFKISNITYKVETAELGQSGGSVNATAVGVAVVIVIVVLVGIIVAVIIAVVVFRNRNKGPVKEKLEEQQNEMDMYSRHSFAVVENPLFADAEEGDEGDDTSYAGGADGFEYDSATLDKKEDLGMDEYEDDIDDKSFI